MVITNGGEGSTIITSSYEARHYGIKVGVKLKEALLMCPHLVRCPTRPERYVAISSNIMAALENEISPDIEIFSIDECFLNLAPILSLYPSIEQVAAKIRHVVYEASEGLPCSIGISEGKLTAKFCAKFNKGATTIIPPHAIRDFMAKAAVSEICGIGKNTAHYLQQMGIHKCEDMASFPISILASRFGDIGRRLYQACLGHDPQPLQKIQPAKTMGHSKIMPPNCTDAQLIEATMRHLCEKLAARLRRHQLFCSELVVGFKGQQWLKEKFSIVPAANGSTLIWQYAKSLIAQRKKTQGIFQLMVKASKLTNKANQQLSLFSSAPTTKPLDQLKRPDQSKIRQSLHFPRQRTAR